MQEKPKRTRKRAFIFLTIGLVLGLTLIVIVSIIWIVSLDTVVTLASIVQLHLTFPLFLLIDILVLFSSLMFGWIGLERDRAEYARRHAEWLSHNHQVKLKKLQAGQAEQQKAQQAEALRLQTEQDEKVQAEVLQLNNQLEEQRLKFQDLETVIRHGKQQWEATFDAVDDLILLTDEAGVIQRCNRTTGEVFHLGYSQILGREIDELFSNGTASLLEMVPGEKIELQAPHSEVWYEVSKNHLVVDTKQEGWVYIFRNVTAKKQALQDQQRLTHYYELLVNNSPVAIITLNQEDRIIDCNPAFERLFLYSKREALGWKADLLISPPDLVFETRGLTETVRKGETVHGITQRQRKDGTLLDVEVFGIPVILGGKQIGSLGLYHDVSDLVRSQKAAADVTEQTPVKAARVLMTKLVKDALIEDTSNQQPVPVEHAAGAPEELEAVDLYEATEEIEAAPLQVPAFEPEEDEQVGVIQPSQDVVMGSNIVRTRQRMVPIEKIEGIGPVYAEKLLAIGVQTTHDLLELGKSRQGREDLAEQTGISGSRILKWVNMADLMRVHGIGEEYSELLEKAGVDTVKELRNRNPKNLFEALLQANEAHKLVRRAPHLSEVESWVNEAKGLEPVLTY